jgi:hypothetical protein
MSQFDNFQGNEFYLKFYRNSAHLHRDRVYVYESNDSGYFLLPLEERCAVDFDYLVALYEIGHYDKYLNKVDDYIETVISENIMQIRGVDVYNQLLLTKNISLYRLKRYVEVLALSNTLLKMKDYSAEERKVFKILIYSSVMYTEKAILTRLKSAIIFCVLFAIALKLNNIFFLEPFHPDQVGSVELGIIGFMIGGVLLVIAMFALIYVKSIGYFARD